MVDKRNIAIGAAAMLIVAGIAFGSGALWNKSGGQPREAAAPNSPRRPNQIEPARKAVEQAAVPAEKSFAAGDILGTQVAYLESKIGPARQVAGPDRVYRIGRCDIGITSNDGTIRGVRIPMSGACATHANSLLASQGLPAKIDLTFGEYAAVERGARFFADCLYMCGNAADPVLYLVGGGSHAQNWIMTRVGASQVVDSALDAGGIIEDAVRAGSGEDYLVDAKFNCDTRYTALAKEFVWLRLKWVTIWS